jgi:hypothetical protein
MAVLLPTMMIATFIAAKELIATGTAAADGNQDAGNGQGK